jgi:GNAT superfamily N-acetyltransferase
VENFQITLGVPPSKDFESVVAAVVADAIRRIGLADEPSQSVRDGVVNAFRLIVEDAMNDCAEPIRLHLAESAEAFRVSLHEKGVPLDKTRAARDPRWNEILQCCDRAAWHWHGKAGTELRLTFAQTALPAAGVAREAHDAVAASPSAAHAYTVRRFRPEDAHGVVRVFHASYGYGYDVPSAYEPRRLCELNKAERYISFVAVDENGDIAGHYALDREPGAPIAEGCGAVVDPRHRGQHLLERLREAAEAHARAIGLSAFFTEPVTDHAVTQNESERMGARITAISLGFSPRTMLARHMDLTSTKQRQSLTLYVKPLLPPEPRTVYAPARHREVLAELYARLQIPLTMREGSEPGGEGSLHVSIVKASGNATITVERVGKETISVVRQAAADAVALGSLGVIYAMLPLSDPGTPALAEVLERDGFIFSGLAPWMIDGKDALRLQRLLEPVDTSELTIASDAGRRLLAYIEAKLTMTKNRSSEY